MNQEITDKDALNEFEKPVLPGFLNVLTILTIIGCVLGFCSSIYSFITAKKNYETLKDAIDSGKMENAPKWARGMMTPEMLEMNKHMYENKLPIVILNLVATALCLYGAIEMRKLKKQGYTFWLIGEILPVFITILFIGMASFSGFGMIIWLFPIAFIIMYTVNRKYLVY